MKTISLIVLILVLFIKDSSGQEVGLGGQYIFEIKGEMFSTYVFSTNNSFLTILSGDMGTFYGEGNYQIIGNKLILNYDSTGVAKRTKKEYYITPTSTDTLTISNIRKQKIDLECDYTGRIETYIKQKFKQKKQ